MDLLCQEIVLWLACTEGCYYNMMLWHMGYELLFQITSLSLQTCLFNWKTLTSSPLAQQECTHTALNSMLLASNMENPYIPDQKLEAVANGSVPFVVTNKAQDPVVLATLPRSMSILKKLFTPATLNVKSFSSDLTQNSTHWLISVHGETMKCPGM